MPNVSILEIMRQVRYATCWLSSGDIEKFGRCVSVVPMKKRIKLVLGGGSTVVWNLSQRTVDLMARLFVTFASQSFV